MTSNLTPTGQELRPIREDWLDRHIEPAIEPDLPIVDCHHHLWDQPGRKYLIEDFARDLNAGHRVRATVYLQGHARYRQDGPEELRPVGETEFARSIAEQSRTGQFGQTEICAAIVGFADLHLGARIQDVLEDHINCADGRFRGIRQPLMWDADNAVLLPGWKVARHALADVQFRQGFARLAPLGLSFDACIFHPQIDDVTDLARSFPETSIVLNHSGFPIGIGTYAGRRQEELGRLKQKLRDLARCSNVALKIGGLGHPTLGFDFHAQPEPPSSNILVDAWRPYVETCIDAFGPERCMFESNFPADKVSCGYVEVWNTFKRLTATYSAAERSRLFSETATEIYRLDPKRGG